MPTNEQRREAAKRKLERQLERRAQRARRRKQLTIAGSVVGVIVIVAGAALVYVLTKSDDDGGGTPVACNYTPSAAPAVRAVELPRTDGVEATDDVITVSMETSQGPIGLTLDNEKSPCTVNNFLSLASQQFYDNTTCTRLTTTDGLKVLQCGDPSGTGQGGPGYQFANEYPIATDEQYMPDNLYTRGTLAMANAGADTNGSQFFLVYADSTLPPDYTIFGTIDEAGLQTLDKVAAAGVVPGESGPGDGKPVLPVDITSVTLDN